MMTCTRTGCQIYIEQYGEYAYGDAFEVDGLVRESPTSASPPPRDFGLKTLLQRAVR